jgi:hypothetical protein
MYGFLFLFLLFLVIWARITNKERVLLWSSGNVALRIISSTGNVNGKPATQKKKLLEWPNEVGAANQPLQNCDQQKVYGNTIYV